MIYMKKNKLIMGLSLLVSFEIMAMIPDNFKEFFLFEDKIVKLLISGDAESETVLLRTNYNTVKLPEYELDESKTKIKKFLKRNNLNDLVIEHFLDDLSRGVESDPLCKGSLAECIVFPDFYSVVYDYDHSYLRFFVNGQFLDKNVNIDLEYADAKNKYGTVINSIDLYANAYNSNSSNYTFNNNTLIGLPLGYITSDLSVTNNINADKFNINELSYDLEYENYRFYGGKFRYTPMFNTTDFLNTNTRYEQISANFGSSQNLLKGDKRSLERIFYYSPAKGELLIYRNGNIIRQKNIDEGQGSIGYDELPSGRYEITLDVVVSGNVISSETVQVYNSARDKLKEGEYDYLFSVGTFQNNRYNHSDIESEYKDKWFAKAAVAARVSAPLTLGAGVLSSSNARALNLGSQVYLPYGFTLGAVANIFDDSNHFFDTSLSNGWLALRYEILSLSNDDNKENNSFIRYLYSDNEYKRISLTGNYRFSGGAYAYSTYSRGKDKSFNTTSSLLNDGGFEYWSVTSGISLPLSRGMTLGLTLDYQDASEDWSTMVTLSVPLDSGYAAKSMLSLRDGSISNIRNSIEKNNILNSAKVNSNLSVAQVYTSDVGDNKNITEAVFSANVNEEKWRGNAYVFADTKGNNRGISGSLSSTQVLKDNRLLLTSDKSKSYALIEVNSADVYDNYGYTTLRRNGKIDNKQFVYDKNNLYPLTSYEEYDISLDTESVSLVNLGDSYVNEFVKPGSILTIKADVRQIVSFLSAFEDVFGNRVNHVTCEGDGCHDVQKIHSGVYQISFMDGLAFELVSDNNICIIPEDKTERQIYNYGKNICVPNLEPMDYIALQGVEKGKNLYFLGLYNEDARFNTVYSLVESLQLITKEIGKYKALYVIADEKEFRLAEANLKSGNIKLANMIGMDAIINQETTLSSVKRVNP